MAHRSKVEQVTAQVRSLVEENAFADGRLPSEPNLAAMMNASRATVRQALAVLELDGLIVRLHGSGTFVNHRVQGMRTRLEEVWDFAEMIELAGHTPAVRHLRLELAPPSSEIAEKLSLSPDNEALTTANIFLADDTPVIYCLDVIPAHLVQSAYREEELHGPVYEFLAARCHQAVEYNITRIAPVIAEPWLVELLDCEPGTPLHYFEEVGFNADHEPIIYSEEIYRPEYFEFKILRKMTTRRLRQPD